MKIKNGLSYEKNGWTYISIKGKPRERGYAYGYLCADSFKEIQTMLKFFIMESYGQTWEYFIKEIKKDFKEMIKENFEEFYEEMEGIAEGCTDNGCKTDVDEIIAWNFYFRSRLGIHLNLIRILVKKEVVKKINVVLLWLLATGRKTEKIVVAHNSFVDYIDGQYAYIILDIDPSEGHRIIMQTFPCWIWSGTDFFVTSKGIIGTETTIGGFMPYEIKFPICYRIRKAMQYGNTLDDYVEILLHENSGDYANSWLFGDTNTNEILRIELGLKYHNVERTKMVFL